MSDILAIDFASELNREQAAVVTAGRGVALVIAGAGSGKTRALTYRVANLLESGVAASSILLLTFTNRAAREMLYRVARLTGTQSPSVWGGTFHHVGNRCLRDYGRAIGIPPTFSILDREDSRRLVGACISDLGVRKRHDQFPAKGALLGLCGLAKNTVRPVSEIITEYPPVFSECLNEIITVLDEYEQRKERQGVLDFDDLLVRFLQLLTDVDSVRTELSSRFHHVLVDEFQDTNAVQGAIVSLLASYHGNLCVVGDDSQSIYRFRGAVFENVLDFHQRYQHATTYKLETNYRSTPEILALANASIACNRRRLPKELRAVRPSGNRPVWVKCPDQAAQTRCVGATVQQLLLAGTPTDEIAVLYRSHYHSLQIQMDLQRRGIAFITRGGLRFFEQAHVKDILAFLRVVHNGRDESSWLRILVQVPGIGEKTAGKFWRHISRDESPMAAALAEPSVAILPRRPRPLFKSLQGLLRKLVASDTPAAMLETLMDDYYAQYVKSEYDRWQRRRDDVYGVLDFARDYGKLDEFLAEVALVGESDSREAAARHSDGEAAITLSTVHQAKGLEWSVVFVPWLTEGRFPIWTANESPEEEEEERRVFHVAVTRAKNELYLLAPQSVPDSHGIAKPALPSRFLTEVPASLFDVYGSGACEAQPRRQRAYPARQPLSGHLAPVHADDLAYEPDVEATPF